MKAGRIQVLCGLAMAATFAATLAAGADQEPDLKQGWSPADIAQWYSIDQGSRLAPKTWLEALEQPDGDGPFLDPAYIERFRYLSSPTGLPIGFAVDDQDDEDLSATKLRWLPHQGSHEPWVGMTCAACHTAELRYGTHVLRVQGGPTLADFQGFYDAFNRALINTRAQSAKLERFETRVLQANGAALTRANRQGVDRALDSLIVHQKKLAAMDQTHAVYGFGRLDAVGYILNKTSFVANPDAPTANEPDAPVSYPFLWNTAQQGRIQWDGIAANGPSFAWNGKAVDIGALGRNVGEVIGVFADVQAPSWLRLRFAYRSSVQAGNLVQAEQQLATLKPPRWPRELFKVDDTLAAEGRQLFAQHCARCHAELGRDDLDTRARPDGQSLELMSVFFPQNGEPQADTDRWMACNTAINLADTGLLRFKLTGDGLQRFDSRAPASLMLASMVKGVMLAKAPELVRDGISGFRPTAPSVRFPTSRSEPSLSLVAPGGGVASAAGYPERKARCDQYAASAHYRDVAYKARPLTGVWATGPFLHNGSVPTLYDLLLPPAQRPRSFFMGTRQFDPVKVGYRTEKDADNAFRFDVFDPSGRIIEGNSNLGHDYGNATLTDHQRWALVEYLKVIGE